MFRLGVDETKDWHCEEKNKPLNTETQRHRGKTRTKNKGFFAFLRVSFVKPCFTSVLRGFDLFIIDGFHQHSS